MSFRTCFTGDQLSKIIEMQTKYMSRSESTSAVEDMESKDRHADSQWWALQPLHLKGQLYQAALFDRRK